MPSPNTVGFWYCISLLIVCTGLWGASSMKINIPASTLRREVFPSSRARPFVVGTKQLPDIELRVLFQRGLDQLSSSVVQEQPQGTPALSPLNISSSSLDKALVPKASSPVPDDFKVYQALLKRCLHLLVSRWSWWRRILTSS